MIKHIKDNEYQMISYWGKKKEKIKSIAYGYRKGDRLMWHRNKKDGFAFEYYLEDGTLYGGSYWKHDKKLGDIVKVKK